MFTQVKFVVLPVTDQARAFAFYTDTLGFAVFRDSPQGKGYRWIELEIPGAETRILFGPGPNKDPVIAPALTLVTPDVADAHRSLAARGVVFTAEPQAAPWKPKAVFAVLTDSENNSVMIEEPYGREALA
jgi:hypothetical protein